MVLEMICYRVTETTNVWMIGGLLDYMLPDEEVKMRQTSGKEKHRRQKVKGYKSGWLKVPVLCRLAAS